MVFLKNKMPDCGGLYGKIKRMEGQRTQVAALPSSTIGGGEGWRNACLSSYESNISSQRDLGDIMWWNILKIKCKKWRSTR
jgi:hypothetical protein